MYSASQFQFLMNLEEKSSQRLQDVKLIHFMESNSVRCGLFRTLVYLAWGNEVRTIIKIFTYLFI